MATTQERLEVLRMIEQRKITPEEGAALLKALQESGGDKSAEPPRGASQPRWFRVRVTDTRSGRNKATVNIPMGLVNIGLRMGARFVPNTDDAQYSQLMEAIKSGRQGKIFEMADETNFERVEIFVE